MALRYEQADNPAGPWKPLDLSRETRQADGSVSLVTEGNRFIRLQPQSIATGPEGGWQSVFNCFTLAYRPGMEFSGALGEGRAILFGFSVNRETGKHFAWGRIHSTNSTAYPSVDTNGHPNPSILDNFKTNNPPVFSEITINPVPYAAIQLGRPSPGGPVISYERLTNGVLRLTYPEWGQRYHIRRRAEPKAGAVLNNYAGGRAGLVPTNGVYTVDVPMTGSQGFFELYLPPEYVAP